MKALVTLVATLTLSALAGLAAAADLKVGMVTSLSGPASSLGIPYARGLRAGHAYKSTIAGRSVQLIVLDDASDPSAAARNARKLIDEEHVDVLIGAATVPATLAIAGFGRESKTPVIAISPVALAGEEGAWLATIVQPVRLMIDGVVDHMRRGGIRSVAYIGFTDAAGDLFHDALQKSAAEAGIKLVANERYARSDPSVAGQVLRIAMLRPDAVLNGGTGSPGALPVLGLAERGYKGAVYGTHGVINADFVRLVGTMGQGLVAPTGPVIVADQLPADNPVRKVALDFKAAYQQVNGPIAIDAFSAYSFDAWLVFADAATRAVAKAEPGTAAFRAELRDAILTSREVVGSHGVYNYRPGSGASGVDQRARVMVRLEQGQWKLLP